MSLTNLELVTQWVEHIWNAGEFQRLPEFHPSVFVNHGGQITIEDVKQWHLKNRATFPDIHYVIDDVFEVNDRVAIRWSATATHSGTLWNLVPPTGKTIAWKGIHLLRLAQGQIVEIWAIQDSLAQLQQMGVQLQIAPS